MTQDSGGWTARRDHWEHPLPRDNAGRTASVVHADPQVLAQLVAWQAELDLWYLHPDWECGQLASGRWAAQRRGGGRIVTAVSAAHLAAELGRLAGGRA